MLAEFFVVSGANLRVSVFSQGVLVLIGVVYIIARAAGKYCGARWSAKAVGCAHTVQKYLGIMLLPQEGVALGMCVSAQVLGADGELIRNIILFSVLIYELVGPLATKESLKAAGASTEKPREVLERRERKLAEAERTHEHHRHFAARDGVPRAEFSSRVNAAVGGSGVDKLPRPRIREVVVGVLAAHALPAEHPHQNGDELLA